MVVREAGTAWRTLAHHNGLDRHTHTDPKERLPQQHGDVRKIWHREDGSLHPCAVRVPGSQPGEPVRLVGAGVFGGREDTLPLAQIHQDDAPGMVRPRRVRAGLERQISDLVVSGACAPRARGLPPDEHRGVTDLWARPRTPEKQARLKEALNAALNEHLRGGQPEDIRALELSARRGIQLGIEVRAQEGMAVVHSDYSVASGQRGIVTRVECSIMGETCTVTWEDGRSGCYAMLELKTADHKRHHGPRDEVPPPASRPGPAPYCLDARECRPRGLVRPRGGAAQQAPEIGLGKDCVRGRFKVYQYQPEVHKRNQQNMHDDLLQIPGFRAYGQ